MSKTFLRFLACWISAVFFGYLIIDALQFQIWKWVIIWATVGLLLILRLTFNKLKIIRASFWIPLLGMNLDSLFSGYFTNWISLFLILCAIIGSAFFIIWELIA